MITLSALTIGYQTKHGQKIVADNIHATIQPGELTCLIGPNGAGKSTLLRTLSAFQPPLAGEIAISGQSLKSLTDRQLSRLIGIVLTAKPSIQNITVSELVALGRSPYTGFWGRLTSGDKQIVEESLRQVGIGHLGERMVQTLSDGERQKMMIAKALAQQTPVILLDEPTAFLDYPSKADMLQLLRRLSRESHKTIFLSTHDLELALQLADTLWLMQPGQPIAVGSPRQLADIGKLAAFLNRPGLRFDEHSLTIQVE